MGATVTDDTGNLPGNCELFFTFLFLVWCGHGTVDEADPYDVRTATIS